ncbi:NADH-quinone oxidoreductase subunit H [Ktedonobacter sp. SOSP1-85]|uniref:NADH-quinone oxidoreductase subunit NuoH n=1 Tax=Ktedonobacter sp. SOSP1-85 TaxID=2778367 RepID=UPI0019167A6B|nr:NADH-quinone oxidoreductase subunit NuoH [Ktedonobacter sp. SOSP1-85]GHO75036.1 NADH-quinone oxidoreductase subunit H [Ktedonobacter sp. SOSP1-85]
MLDFLNNEIVAAVIKSAIVIAILLTVFAYMTLIERRVLAKIQGRLGPNRVGPFGLLQPLADGIKMAFKEQLVPGQARKFIYGIAPILSTIVALSAFAVVPVGLNWSGKTSVHNVWDPLIADVNIGLLWILAISSLAVYGIVLGGWASGNRYSMLGALRSAAQMVSYETSLSLALGSVLMWSQTLSMVGIIDMQRAPGMSWFILAQPLGFVIYLIAGIAETNRAPFDLPEAEQELTAGYLTEYAGLRWSLYQMAEYINMITVSSVATTLYLGGWSLFGLETLFPGASIIIYVVKVAIFLFVFMWLRATLPRIRYDRLMRFGWQLLLPLAVLNAVITAFVVALGWHWAISGVAGLVVIAIMFFVARRQGFSEGTRFEEKQGKVLLPTSVRLVKYEPKAVTESTSSEQEPTAVQA